MASPTSGAAGRIDYLAPDYDRPSWGVALLYHHVGLLRELGFDARVLHHRAPFRATWLEVAAPIAHLDALDREPSGADLLIVPEVMAAQAACLPFDWRRVVFVQGSFLIASGLGGAMDYAELGYQRALVTMPHMVAIVERHFGVGCDVVPPFVAPYFLRPPREIAERPRRRLVVLVMKPEYRQAGFPDYDLFTRLTRSRFADAGGLDGAWQLLELDGSLAHAEVAELLAEAAFLVNLNSHEGWNATVVEAMAAGCLPICYDAFGGLDFLVDGENAFVFPNHHVFPLAEKTLALIDGVDAAASAAAGSPPGDDLVAMRLRAREHAARFDVSATRDALGRVYPRLLAGARS